LIGSLVSVNKQWLAPDTSRAARVLWIFTLTATAYNLVRLPKLLGAAA
jgi:hypothetical protein